MALQLRSAIPAGLFVLVGLLSGLNATPAWSNGNDGPGMVNPDERRISGWMSGRTVTESQWDGDIELGYLSTHGNTNSQTLLTRWRIQNDRPSWIHAFRLEAIYIEKENESLTELYKASHKSAYKITGVDYLFGLIRYEKNIALGFQYRLAEVAGYGRRIFQTKSAVAFLEAGTGQRQTREMDRTLTHEDIAVVLGEFNWNISQTTQFNQQVFIESGERNNLRSSTTGLTMRVSGNFSTKLTYEATRNSNVPPGVQRTEANGSVTLVYTF